ncbi:MAG: GGDEF domain-containing protein [Methylophaga sp.]
MINPHQLSSHLFRELHRHPTVSLIHHAVFAALLAVYLWPQLPPIQFAVWLLLVFSGGIWQWHISRHFNKAIAVTVKPQSLSQFTNASLAAGLSFGLTALLLPELSFETRLFVILMMSAVAASELLKLSAFPTIYAAFLLGLTAPLLFMLVLPDANPGWEIIPAILLMIVVLYYSAVQRRRDLIDDLMSRFDLENDAGEDKLTHIANRRRFDMMLEQVWAQARRSGIPISLVMIDIDFFKQFNDKYGHQAGDKCLTQVARTLADTARRATDLVARYGGEEFVVLLNQTTRDDAYQLADRMRTAVESLHIENADTPSGYVTISLGGATVFASELEESANPLKLADEALYRSKAAGRNQVSWHQFTD